MIGALMVIAVAGWGYWWIYRRDGRFHRAARRTVTRWPLGGSSPVNGSTINSVADAAPQAETEDIT